MLGPAAVSAPATIAQINSPRGVVLDQALMALLSPSVVDADRLRFRARAILRSEPELRYS